MILVFDLDNTLINRNKAYWLWLENNVLPKLNTIDKDLILYYDNWGYTSRHHFYNWLIIKYDLPFTPDFLIQKCANELHNFISKNQNILEILATLKKSYRVVIGSNGGTTNQINKLKKADILQYADRVFISEAVGYKKPNPEFYKHIQEEMNCSPNEFIFIGDHYKQDYLAPKKLGWKSIWLTHHRNSIIGDCIFSLNDLIPYLRKNKNCL